MPKGCGVFKQDSLSTLPSWGRVELVAARWHGHGGVIEYDGVQVGMDQSSRADRFLVLGNTICTY